MCHFEQTKLINRKQSRTRTKISNNGVLSANYLTIYLFIFVSLSETWGIPSLSHSLEPGSFCLTPGYFADILIVLFIVSDFSCHVNFPDLCFLQRKKEGFTSGKLKCAKLKQLEPVFFLFPSDILFFRSVHIDAGFQILFC